MSTKSFCELENGKETIWKKPSHLRIESIPTMERYKLLCCCVYVQKVWSKEISQTQFFPHQLNLFGRGRWSVTYCFLSVNTYYMTFFSSVLLVHQVTKVVPTELNNQLQKYSITDSWKRLLVTMQREVMRHHEFLDKPIWLHSTCEAIFIYPAMNFSSLILKHLNVSQPSL